MSPGVNPRPSLNERAPICYTRTDGHGKGVAGGEPPALIERPLGDMGACHTYEVSPGVNPRPSLNDH